MDNRPRWKNVWFILDRDLRYTLKEKSTLAWLFLMPVLFTYFIGNATGSFGGGGSRPDRLAVSIPADAGFLADRVIYRLEDNGFEVIRFDGDLVRLSEGDIPFERYARQLRLPPGLTDRVVGTQQSEIEFASSRDSIAADYDNYRVQRAVYTVLADVMVAQRGESGLGAEGLAAVDELPRAISLRVAPAGQRKTVPVGFEQTVPGIMVMFTLLILLTSGAVLILNERKQGLLRRLAATPITHSEVVAGKWLGKSVLGLVQIGFAMVAGTLLFDMNWGPDLAMVAVVLIMWALFCAGIGLWLGSVGRSEGQVSGLGVLVANVLAALGGCWWPIEIAPEWMQQVQMVLPTGWVMDALHRLISFQSGAADVLPHLLALSISALFAAWLAGRHFRYD